MEKIEFLGCASFGSPCICNIVPFNENCNTLVHPLALYTLFVTVHKQWQNYFFTKKIKFRETWRKEVYTLFVIDPSFHGEYGEKSSLNSSKNCLLRWTHFTKKFLAKRSQIWRITQHTICVSHRFHPFVPFSSLFANSVWRAIHVTLVSNISFMWRQNTDIGWNRLMLWCYAVTVMVYPSTPVRDDVMLQCYITFLYPPLDSATGPKLELFFMSFKKLQICVYKLLIFQCNPWWTVQFDMLMYKFLCHKMWIHSTYIVFFLSSHSTPEKSFKNFKNWTSLTFSIIAVICMSSIRVSSSTSESVIIGLFVELLPAAVELILVFLL